jgi:hypothetical protein
MSRAVDSGSARGWIIIALVPWGLSLYAYAMSFMVIPIMLILAFLFYRNIILQNWKAWVISAGLFALFALPLLLFLFKNFVAHDTMEIERSLPFGIPLLLTTRLQYVSSSIPGRWVENFLFVIIGFQEGDYRVSLLGRRPIFLILLPLCLVGIERWLREFRETRRPELFFVWVIASLPIFVLIDAGVAHFNSFILPMLVASVYGLLHLVKALEPIPQSRKVF